MKSNSILFSEKKKLVKYNPSKYSSEWELDFEYNVYGISRIDNFVFVTTYSNWGKTYTSLVEFDTGKKLWTLKEIFYTVHIIGDKIIYKDKKKYFNGIDINTGKNIFNSKPPYTWSTPKAMLLNGKFFLYNSKKTCQLNLENGDYSETKLPRGLDPSEIDFVLDEFQININNMPQSGGDSGHYFMMGDAGGGDAGGGDAGGGGDGGGGDG